MEFIPHQLINQLQRRDECRGIEAKTSQTTLGKSALETISSFSNEPGLDGGYLILGLQKNDDETSTERYNIIGVNDPDKIQNELTGVCATSFNIQIRPEIRLESIDGKIVILAFIPEAFCRDKPVYIKAQGIEKGTFRRIGSGDSRCTSEDLDLLYQLKRQHPYEAETFPGASWNDISSDAISEYRRLRHQVDPMARELKLDDQSLMVSLGHAIHKNSDFIPTIGGLLLFGSKAALRRMMPMAARVDYLLVEGTEWVQSPSSRYHSIEYLDGLITILPRLHAQIMNDLPTKFKLEIGELQRSDIPSIPRDVIREALANALMHRDYRVNQPVQIIRYSNRIEFHNPGYSLKPFEELGLPGSITRNGRIAAVFHDLKFAETKGTGIATMKKLINEAGLSTQPIIETERDSNKFNLLLLMHHLLDEENLRWLSRLKEFDLTEADMRALVFVKEVGALTNQDYRQINGTQTATASKALGRLRDMELLSMKSAGMGTYYTMGSKIRAAKITPDISLTPLTSPLSGGITPLISPLSGELAHHIIPIPSQIPLENQISKKLDMVPALPQELKQQIISLGERANPIEIKSLIRKICSQGPIQLTQLAQILGRDPKYLRDYYLSKMVKSGELIYQYSDQPAHPQQAYKMPNEHRL